MRGSIVQWLLLVALASVCGPAIGSAESSAGDEYRVFPSVLAPCGGLVCEGLEHDLLFTLSESVAGVSRNDSFQLWSGFRYERKVNVICPDVSGVYSDPVGPVASSALLLPMPTPTRGPVPINYQVRRAGPVRLAILDIQGRLVRQMAEQILTPGRYETTWDGFTSDGRLASTGIYFVRYSAGDLHDVTRIVLIR